MHCLIFILLVWVALLLEILTGWSEKLFFLYDDQNNYNSLFQVGATKLHKQLLPVNAKVETEAMSSRNTTTSVSAVPKCVEIDTNVKTETMGSRNTTSFSAAESHE